MVPIVIGDSRAALDASRRLEAEGFLVVAIRPPTVPDGTARLRIAFTARHPDREIDRLADAIRAHILAPA
jgi:8-amino-7-oxononanoate synthase